MDVEFMRAMGDELVPLCDLIRHHGLVDYEMGVWEEWIIERVFAPRKVVGMPITVATVLCECLDLLEDHSGKTGSSSRLRASDFHRNIEMTRQ